MSAYDDYLNGLEQEDQKRNKLTQSLGAAASVNPDEFAGQVKLAKAAAISLDVLPQYKEEAQQAKLFGEVGLEKLWKDAPKTSDFLSHPDNAKLSHDDTGNLSGFEQAAKTLKNYGGAFGEGIVGQGVGTLFSGAGRLYDITARQLAKPIIAVGGDTAKDFLEAPISPYLDPSRMLLKNPGEALKAAGKAMGPEGSDRTFGTDVAGGLGQLGGQALVQYLTGGTVSSLSLLAQGTDIVGEKVEKDNASQDAKDSAMLGGGLITSVTEKYALDKILGPLAVPVKNAIAASLARIGVAAVAEGGQEIAENIGHDALRKLLTNQDAKIDLPGAAYEGGVGATVGGIARGVIEAALHVRVRGAQREQEAQQAGQMGELLTGMTKLAEASKLRERDVETAQGFFQSVLDEGRDSVFITPEAFAQSGLAEQIAQAIPAVAEQMQTAAESGHDIRLPIAELMATMAGPELAQSIIPHVAVDPGGFTPTTAQEYMQSDKAAELQAEVEKILGEKQVDDTFKASAEIVKSRIVSELAATTRWDASKNEADATIYSAYYAVRAAQLGVTPEKLYDQRRVNFSDVLVDGQQYDQSGRLVTDTPNFVKWFADSKVVDADGKPLVVYHGTTADISEFDPSRTQQTTGVFFASNPEYANAFAQGRSGNGNVMPVFLSLQNPAYIEANDYNYDTLNSAMSDESTDGVIVRNEDGSIYVVVAKDPTQIKSVNNRGTFDANDPNILNQSAAKNVPVPEGTADVAGIDNANKIAAAEKFDYIRDLKVKLQDAVIAAADGTDLTAMTQAVKDYLVGMGVTEGMKALGSNANAVGWYDEKTRQALSVVGLIHPEILTDENARFAFIYALAVTSNGQLVLKNFELAERAYSMWKNDGSMPGDIGAGGTARKAIHASLARFNELVKQFGSPAQVAEFMLTEFTVKEMDQAGFSVSGENKTETVLGSAILGPKIGNGFFANLYGIFDQLTMDRWLMRTWGRWTGSLLANNQAAIAEESKVLAAIVKGVKADKAARDAARSAFAMTVSGKIDKAKLKVFDDLVKEKNWEHVAEQIKLKSAYPEIRKMLMSTPLTDALRLSGNRLANKLDGQNEAPNGGSHRKWIREVFGYILDTVRQQYGKPIEMADLQALLWYPEKRLYDSAKSDETKDGYEDDEAPDYANAAAALARSRGISEESIASALANPTGRSGIVRRKRDDGRAVQPGGQQVEGNNGQSQDGQVLNQNNEKKLGAFSPQDLTVTMLQGANFTTTLHEGAHFFFENDIFLASQILADADIHGYDTLSVGEKQILLDVSKLMDWHGIKGDITEQLRQWENMDFEERRSHHERTAESFERYLFEGKAPSIELQPYFQRFAAWWKKVYTSMQNFLAKNPEAGKLNPEITAVFDRMLATTEQIQLAEQGRSMMPMFRTQAEADNVGMTPEEFAAYQHQDVDATNTAIDELQARGLRDMQWIHNAHGRVIKQLQKESAAKRAEVQMEARAEIMSQPVYRAWAFLTGRMTADDKVTAPKQAKSDPNVLDETVDSLFVAIAKLGGIKKDDVVTSWGVDPKDKPTSGLFGKPLWRVDGGLSIDGMAEALSQYGYLEQDENGKWDIRELEDKFKAELGGDTQFSTAYDYAGDQAPGKAGEEVINPDAVQAGRLSRSAVEEMGLPVELVNHLVALKMVAKEGWHPDLIAERFAFESGDDMVRRIAATESPKDAINGLTDQRMLERFGDLSSQEAIAKAADKAIHNEVRARMMATELNALEKAVGKRKTLASAAKEYAAAMIGRVKVRDLKPGQYASAEARALKAAQAAIKSGDIAKAAAEQRNALINNYATRSAHDAQDGIEKLRRDMASLANRSDDKLKKSYDIDLINAVRAILGEYGIAEKKAKRAIDYLEVFKQNDPDMYAVVSEAIENASRNAKPYRELTVDDAVALGEEVGAILHLAKRSRQMEVDGDMIDRQEIEDALRARLVALGVPESMPGDAGAITPGEVAMQNFRTRIAALKRVESWVGKMDGADTFGPFRRYIFGRVKNAADAYRSDKAKYLKQFSDLFESIRPTLKPALIAAPELGYTFGKDAGGSGINEIVHAILHTGNASNKRKLLLGRDWAQERPDGSLDTSRWDAFIQRMADEGKITKAHFDFAQGIWDLLESTKPLAQKTHRDVFGKYFDEVTAEPLNSPFGMYAGGYVPAMADSRVVADANMRALSEVENQSMQFAFPTTAKGFTKGRVEYNAPLMLDLRTLSQHIDKVLMFSHLEMPVRDVQRVMKGIGGTLNRVDPAAIPGMIIPWLNRAAKQQVVTPISNDAGTSRFLSVMRSRAGAAAMFGNLANAVQQITGFSLAALKVRPSLMLSATADYAKHPRVFVAGVSEASPYMAERLNSEVAAMNDNINQILLNPSLLEKGQAWSMQHAYFLQTAIDSAMSPIIWTAAYNQALEQGHSHDDAVRLGDSAVRETQGSTLPEDISRFEAGPAWFRLFTQFAGYFNMQANLLGTEYAKMIQQDYGLRKNASKGLFIFMLGFYVPAVVGELVMQLFKGGPGDDDKDGEYLDDWLAVLFGWAPLRTATAMVPLVGQVAIGAINATNSKPYDDRLATSPSISMLESSLKAGPSVYAATFEGGSQQKAVRDVATLISMTVGIPANIAARPIGYMAGVGQSKIVPTSEADMARGLVTGIASPDSKR